MHTNMPYSTAEPGPDVTPQATLHYAVRLGMHGQVGRLSTSEGSYRRGQSVICRTARGLEVGQVLNSLRWTGALTSADDLDGRIVRALLPEDQVLWNQLKHLAGQAQQACQLWLDQSGLKDQLLDVEPLLDGRTLYFHFLDQASAETAAQIEKLVQIYQETVAASSFAKLLEHGCGPGCGTDKAAGCSSCVSCTVSSRCKSSTKRSAAR